MQNHEKNTQSPVPTINEQIYINKEIIEREEQALKILIKNYLSYAEASCIIECVTMLHHEFLENHENFEELTPDYICSINYQIKEMILFLVKVQESDSKVKNAHHILNTLTSNLS